MRVELNKTRPATIGKLCLGLTPEPEIDTIFDSEEILAEGAAALLVCQTRDTLFVVVRKALAEDTGKRERILLSDRALESVAELLGGVSGKIEAGEDANQALLREIMEELGIFYLCQLMDAPVESLPFAYLVEQIRGNNAPTTFKVTPFIIHLSPSQMHLLTERREFEARPLEDLTENSSLLRPAIRYLLTRYAQSLE